MQTTLYVWSMAFPYVKSNSDFGIFKNKHENQSLQLYKSLQCHATITYHLTSRILILTSMSTNIQYSEVNVHTSMFIKTSPTPEHVTLQSIHIIKDNQTTNTKRAKDAAADARRCLKIMNQYHTLPLFLSSLTAQSNTKVLNPQSSLLHHLLNLNQLVHINL